jgi:hypothetical protein
LSRIRLPAVRRSNTLVGPALTHGREIEEGRPSLADEQCPVDSVVNTLHVST